VCFYPRVIGVWGWDFLALKLGQSEMVKIHHLVWGTR